jgi:hypothetical protein
MIILKHIIGFLSENELCSVEYINTRSICMLKFMNLRRIILTHTTT